jgi:hypothetical protein
MSKLIYEKPLHLMDGATINVAEIHLPYSQSTVFVRRRKGKDTIQASQFIGDSKNVIALGFAILAQLTYRADGSMVRYEELAEMDGEDTDALFEALGGGAENPTPAPTL